MIHFLRDVYFVFVLNSIYNINYGTRTSRSSFSNILPFIFNFLTHLFTEFSISSITNRSKLDFIRKMKNSTISNSLSFISRNNLWKSLSKNIDDDYLFKNKKKLVQLSYFILKIIYIDSICFKLIRDVSKNFFSFLEKQSIVRNDFRNDLYKNGTRERQFSNWSVESVKPVSAQKEVIAWHAFAGSFQSVDTQANRLLDSLTFYENRA